MDGAAAPRETCVLAPHRREMEEICSFCGAYVRESMRVTDASDPERTLLWWRESPKDQVHYDAEEVLGTTIEREQAGRRRWNADQVATST